MAKLTKFTLSPSGELVYRSTGKKAPAGYFFRKNTVYKVGDDGVRRRVGSLSRNLTKAEASRIAKAEQSRQRRTGRAAPKQPPQGKPRKPSKKAKAAASQEFGEDWDQFTDSEFPEEEEAVIEEFAQRVRDCALSVAPPALQKKIQALTSAAIWKAYQEDQYIFEIYFQYHQPSDEPHKSDVSVWLYQMVKRIEQYMDVSE